MIDRACETCADPDDDPRDACPESKRPCGHHCNCTLNGSRCDWCGQEPYGEQSDYEAFREVVDAVPIPAE